MRAYTLRGEKERVGETERGGRGGGKRAREGGWGRGRKRGEGEGCNIARLGPPCARIRVCVHASGPLCGARTQVRARAPYQRAKLDFMCDRMPSRRDSYANRNRVVCTRANLGKMPSRSRGEELSPLSRRFGRNQWRDGASACTGYRSEEINRESLGEFIIEFEIASCEYTPCVSSV